MLLLKTHSRGRAATVASLLALSVASNLLGTTVTSTWTGTNSTLWSNAGNWSPSAVNPPSNGNNGVSDYNVIIGAPSPTVLDINVTIDSLTINTGGNLQAKPGTTFTVNGPTVTDNGTITIADGSTNAATVVSFAANTTLTGNGTLFLDDNSNPVVAQLNTAANVTLTQGANHTINGHGEISAALINNGTVNANVANTTLILQSYAMTNNNLFKATAGTLYITGITVTQGSAGQLSAAGGIVDVVNSTVTGGTLASSGGGVIQLSGISGMGNPTNSSSSLHLIRGSTVSATGNIIDNGLVTIADGSTNAGTTLTFSGGTLSGTGTLFLDDNSNPVVAELNGTLTQAAGHTITGHGEINAALTNNGTVSATGGTLILQTNAMTNNNLMEATTGTLNISGITVTQGATNQILAATGTVNLINATVSGGILNTSGGGVISISGTSTISSLTTNGTLKILPGTSVSATGSIVDNGTITIADGSINAATSLTFSGGTLSGTGTLFLNDNANPVVAQLNGTLTQSADHTIVGHGEINATFTNNGVVNANGTGLTLNILGPSVINTNLMEATNGGTLAFGSGGTVTNTGALITATTGNISIGAGTTITGGTLTSVGSNSITVSGATFNNITLSTGTQTNITAGYVLTLNGPTVTNNGTIVVNATGVISSTSLTVGGGIISGTGTIVLNDGTVPNAAHIDGSLTQAAGHTIQGDGNINATLINNGTIFANIAGNSLNLNANVTNNNLIEATLGILGINFTTVTQAPGAQIAASPGNVVLNGASIANGTLNSSGGGLFQVVNSSSITSLTSNAPITITGGLTLTANGNIVDNGGITVNTTGAITSTSLTVGGGIISGTGTIVLNDGTVPNAAHIDGSLTQAAGHTIQGDGNINATLINNGTVIANTAGTSLFVNNTTTNNGLFQASNGASLVIVSGVLSNFANNTLTGGTYEADNGSTISLPGAILTNAATVILGGNGTFAAINNFSNNTGSFTITNGASFTTVTPFSNTGTLQATNNSNLTIPGTLAQDTTGTLTAGTYIVGTGSVLNLSNSPNITTIGALASVTLGGTGSFPAINNFATNNGSFSLTNGATFTTVTPFSNTGTLQAASGSHLTIPGTLAQETTGTLTAGTYIVGANATLSLSASPGITTIGAAAAVVLNGPGYSFPAINSLATNAGSLTIANGAALSLPGTYTQTANATLAGNGTLSATALFGNLSTVVGTVQVFANGTNAATSKLTALAIAGTTNAWTGDLAIANNKLIVEASSPAAKPALLATLENQVTFGRTHPAGITSSSLPAHTALAVIDNAVTNFATFGGLPVDTNSLLLGAELLGDANLDGTVNNADLSIVLNHFGAPTLAWTSGNFTGDPTVNLTDFAYVINNFGLSYANPSDSVLSTQSSSLPSSAPEPASLLCLAAVATFLPHRRSSSNTRERPNVKII